VIKILLVWYTLVQHSKLLALLRRNFMAMQTIVDTLHMTTSSHPS